MKSRLKCIFRSLFVSERKRYASFYLCSFKSFLERKNFLCPSLALSAVLSISSLPVDFVFSQYLASFSTPLFNALETLSEGKARDNVHLSINCTKESEPTFNLKISVSTETHNGYGDLKILSHRFSYLSLAYRSIDQNVLSGDSYFRVNFSPNLKFDLHVVPEGYSMQPEIILQAVEGLSSQNMKYCYGCIGSLYKVKAELQLLFSNMREQRSLVYCTILATELRENIQRQ